MKSNPCIKSIRPILGMLALSVIGTLVTSCRTTEGFGRDLQKVGSKIENEAEKRG